MKKEDIEQAVITCKRSFQKIDNVEYVIRLYVAGTTPKSAGAIAAIKQVCEEQLKGNCDLEVIDVYQRPELAEGEQIIALPTLIRKLPLPLRKIIGDLSSAERIIVGLDLRPKRDEH